MDSSPNVKFPLLLEEKPCCIDEGSNLPDLPRPIAAKRGIRERAAIKEAKSENVTVKASSLNNCPATPTTNIIGKNTATVVSVEENMAPDTSFAPDIEASFVPFFF